MGAHVGPHVSVQIRHWMMTARVPAWQSDLCIVLPKRQQHCGTAGLADPPCLLPCHAPPAGWGLPCSSHWMLELTDVPSQPRLLLQIMDIKRCTTHRVTVSAPPRTNRDNRGISLYLLGNLHQQTPSKGCIWQLRVQQRHTPTLPLPWHCTVPLSFSALPCQIHFSKHCMLSWWRRTIAPPPQRTTCVSTLCCHDREDFIHSPALFPFSISHWVLNHGRLWEMLRPWQEAAAAAGCCRSNYNPAEGSRLPFPFPWK